MRLLASLPAILLTPHQLRQLGDVGRVASNNANQCRLKLTIIRIGWDGLKHRLGTGRGRHYLTPNRCAALIGTVRNKVPLQNTRLSSNEL